MLTLTDRGGGVGGQNGLKYADVILAWSLTFICDFIGIAKKSRSTKVLPCQF